MNIPRSRFYKYDSHNKGIIPIRSIHFTTHTKETLELNNEIRTE